MSDDERAAIEEGLTAYDKLLAQLADVPTLAGPTPRELGRGAWIELRSVSTPAASPQPRPESVE